MTNRHWRELVEIVGVIGIVAAMILVASELREGNRIAVAQAKMQFEMQISERHETLNIARASDPNIAKLFPKLEAPDAHLITATEAAQIRGIAWHEINSLWSVHGAYKKDLITHKFYSDYVAGFADTMERWPGLIPHYVEIYRNFDAIQGLDEYAPIADYIAARPENPAP